MRTTEGNKAMDDYRDQRVSALPDLVTHKRFTSVKLFRRGYDQDQVDDFLDEVVAAAKDNKPPYQIVSMIQRQKFEYTKFREGYDVDEVDDFLDSIVEDLSGPRP